MKRIILSIRIFICRLFESPLFILKIDNGRLIQVTKGAKNNFIADCTEIITRNQLQSGFIYAVKDAYNKPAIKTSGEISTDILQQLRNTFSLCV